MHGAFQPTAHFFGSSTVSPGVERCSDSWALSKRFRSEGQWKPSKPIKTSSSKLTKKHSRTPSYLSIGKKKKKTPKVSHAIDKNTKPNMKRTTKIFSRFDENTKGVNIKQTNEELRTLNFQPWRMLAHADAKQVKPSKGQEIAAGRVPKYGATSPPTRAATSPNSVEKRRSKRLPSAYDSSFHSYELVYQPPKFIEHPNILQDSHGLLNVSAF